MWPGWLWVVGAGSMTRFWFKSCERFCTKGLRLLRGWADRLEMVGYGVDGEAKGVGYCVVGGRCRGIACVDSSCSGV